MDSSYHLLSRVDVDRLCRGERSASPIHSRHERAEEISSMQEGERDNTAKEGRTWKEDREGIYGKSEKGRERKGMEREEEVGNVIEEGSSVLETWESIEKEKNALAEKEDAFVIESAIGEKSVLDEGVVDEESAIHRKSPVGKENTIGVKSATGGMRNVTKATRNMTLVREAGSVLEEPIVDTEEVVRNVTLGLQEGGDRQAGAKRVVPFPSARPRQVLREKCWPRYVRFSYVIHFLNGVHTGVPYSCVPKFLVRSRLSTPL